jgi:hypothetical protein
MNNMLADGADGRTTVPVLAGHSRGRRWLDVAHERCAPRYLIIVCQFRAAIPLLSEKAEATVAYASRGSAVEIPLAMRQSMMVRRCLNLS